MKETNGTYIRTGSIILWYRRRRRGWTDNCLSFWRTKSLLTTFVDTQNMLIKIEMIIQSNAKVSKMLHPFNHLSVKGIVHPKMKIWCSSAYPQRIQDVGDFVSSVEHKQKILTQTVAVCQSYNGRTHGFERQKKIHTQNQIKPCGSWRYIEVLRHETISLCKKQNSIYIVFLPLIHRTVQLSWARSQHPVRDASTCSGIVDACAEVQQKKMI